MPLNSTTHVTDQSWAATSLRSHLAGSLRSEHIGTKVKLGGWVHRVRDLGGLLFLDLRDREGIVQVSFDPKRVSESVMHTAASLGAEDVVLLEGTVAARPADGRNDDMPTGAIEVYGETVRVVSRAVTPVIPVARGRNEKLPSEDLRLRHRYLDLRRPELQRNLILRHRLAQRTHQFLSDLGFLELETPILTKPTPEGARDYLVPSRVHRGEFYALPQSPQLYKQLFMMSGFDRYFQIARCFRDEDLRADRQPEFTQIDIEASFVGRDDVLAIAEGLVRALWKEGGIEVPAGFRRMSYAEAMESYGTDKPDLRFDLRLFDATEVFASSEFGITRSAIAAGGRIRGVVLPGGASLSRRQVDELEAGARKMGAPGLLRLKRVNDVLEGPAAKFLDAGAANRLGLANDDLVLLAAGPDHVTSAALDRVRQDAAALLGLVPDDRHEFVIVQDFPLFELDPDSGALASLHHPFTAPHPDDIHLLDEHPERARAVAYDIVYDGLEIGGGSIRISDPDVQSRVFSILGIREEEAAERFGFLLEALRSGVPPHGGIAFGLDRITMLLAGAQSLRDVIAFPKTTAARALFEGAPSQVPESDIAELGLRVEVPNAG